MSKKIINATAAELLELVAKSDLNGYNKTSWVVDKEKSVVIGLPIIKNIPIGRPIFLAAGEKVTINDDTLVYLSNSGLAQAFIEPSATFTFLNESWEKVEFMEAAKAFKYDKRRIRVVDPKVQDSGKEYDGSQTYISMVDLNVFIAALDYDWYVWR
jgi:hypothetical protein